jgi:hypothetical protein
MAWGRRRLPHSLVKIAFVTETFPPEINGVAMTFGVIARELGRRRHEVTVYRPRRPDLPDSPRQPEFLEFPMPGVPIPGYSRGAGAPTAPTSSTSPRRDPWGRRQSPLRAGSGYR